MWEEHPHIQGPKDPDAPLWRYMDFTKYVSLLERSALFFPSAARLEDPFEGRRGKVSWRLAVARDPEWRKILEWSDGATDDFLEKFRHCVYISSWHLNRGESAAMWRLYLQSDEGIAVRTSAGRLKASLCGYPDPVYIGTVRYIDYGTEPVPDDNLLWVFLHKRASFEHEREVRAITTRNFDEVWHGRDLASLPAGLSVPVDLQTLLAAVHISPTAPSWLTELVRDVTQRYGIACDILQSDLMTGPM